MLKFPADLAGRYDNVLERSSIAPNHRSYYQKWLRFYLDFCHKYTFEPTDRNSFPYFNSKLKEKRQPEPLRRQARHAVSLYYEMIAAHNRGAAPGTSASGEQPARVGERG